MLNFYFNTSIIIIFFSLHINLSNILYIYIQRSHPRPRCPLLECSKSVAGILRCYYDFIHALQLCWLLYLSLHIGRHHRTRLCIFAHPLVGMHLLFVIVHVGVRLEGARTELARVQIDASVRGHVLLQRDQIQLQIHIKSSHYLRDYLLRGPATV